MITILLGHRVFFYLASSPTFIACRVRTLACYLMQAGWIAFWVGHVVQFKPLGRGDTDVREAQSMTGFVDWEPNSTHTGEFWFRIRDSVVYGRKPRASCSLSPFWLKLISASTVDLVFSAFKNGRKEKKEEERKKRKERKEKRLHNLFSTLQRAVKKSKAGESSANLPRSAGRCMEASCVRRSCRHSGCFLSMQGECWALVLPVERRWKEA